MSNLVTCPACKSEFAVTEALKSQLSGQVRAELEMEFAAKNEKLRSQEQHLRQAEEVAREKEQSLDEEIAKRTALEAKKLKAEANKNAKQELAIELADSANQIEELNKKVTGLQSQELTLRKRERELSAAQEELKLETARELEAKSQQIRDEARAQFKSEHDLKKAEQDQKISELTKQIDDLKRRAEQGSQQTQGEVQELALEGMLCSSFMHDSIEPVAKGANGADVQQRVFDSSGNDCGSILWESKRTKAWSNTWLAKLRDDQRAARAECAVIVTQSMPPGTHNLTLIDGVWVCSWACAEGLARALRFGLLEAGKNRMAANGRGEKQEMVYAYLSGQEFKRCIEGIVEAFVAMRSDLDKEKRAMASIWKRREKQIERAVGNAAGLYGDLQGIIGNSLPMVAELTLEGGDGETNGVEDATPAGSVSTVSLMAAGNAGS